MQFKYLKRFVLILLLIESSRASAAFITTKIVDVSGRPLADVAVEIYFLKSYSEHDVRRISLATLVSDKDGIVVGTYDENSIPADESFFVSLTKNGYHGYDRSFDFNRSFSDVIPNLVMEREFNDDDVRLIASLSGEM